MPRCAIVMQLCKEKLRVCAVGDDSQSIYSFRGANIDNILNYQKQLQGYTSLQAGAELPLYPDHRGGSQQP